ncbi:hypothetical protein [Rhodococcus sp. C-2]|uniref:hypothetical protein n=1 Tax=Rhodococcus sp. C-2 TaxID=3018809 RepID=UPI0022EA7BAE|nr:hypothetical protein [Rhodococcus sp. C-2]MDA3633982.1 hypothetical protein [Rhodococcus sp. C-2]
MTEASESMALAASLIALAMEGRAVDIHMMLTLMSDAERTGVLLSAIAFGASAQERMDEAHGLDITESPEFLRNAALKLTAPEEKN